MINETLAALATRIVLEGGITVRASEAIGEVGELIERAKTDPEMSRMIPVTDPGDERHKLVMVDRVMWIEQEPES